MKKYFLIFSFLIATLSQSFAIGHIKENKNLLATKKWGEVLERPSPWSYGGIFGINFIQDGFVFNFSPMLTYRAGNKVFLGLSSGISYYQQKYKYFNLNTQLYDKFTLKTTYYDNSLFLRWFALGLIFIQAEPGIVTFDDVAGYRFDAGLDKVIVDSKRKTIPYVQMGGGFVIPFGEEKFLIIRCMYDVLQNKESPYYGLPIIRGGINIGI
jgi:hypothetical protein